MSQNFLGEIIPKQLSKKELTDAGLALILILLILELFIGNSTFYKIAIPVVILSMIFPGINYPFAIFWYSFSRLLGFFMSRVILTIVYVVILIPVGLIRRVLGKDILDLGKFKKNGASALKSRNHTFSANDLKFPY
jgi:hypothetical protein